MRISDWSSDVCSSDLQRHRPSQDTAPPVLACHPFARDPCGGTHARILPGSFGQVEHAFHLGIGGGVCRILEAPAGAGRAVGAGAVAHLQAHEPALGLVAFGLWRWCLAHAHVLMTQADRVYPTARAARPGPGSRSEENTSE